MLSLLHELFLDFFLRTCLYSRRYLRWFWRHDWRLSQRLSSWRISFNVGAMWTMRRGLIQCDLQFAILHTLCGGVVRFVDRIIQLHQMSGRVVSVVAWRHDLFAMHHRYLGRNDDVPCRCVSLSLSVAQ